jgi:hypothetical protein
MTKVAVAFTFLIILGLLVSNPVRAALVEVDVTIEAVDAKTRGVTVSYHTNLRQKSIDLDVSRRAEITVNGVSGTLDSLRPGQRAKVTYENELQVVTKIAARRTSDTPDSVPPAQMENKKLGTAAGAEGRNTAVIGSKQAREVRYHFSNNKDLLDEWHLNFAK